MDVLVDWLSGKFAEAGLSASWAAVAAAALCAAGTLAGAFALSRAAAAAGRRAAAAVAQKRKMAVLLRTASWFLFVWILLSWLPDVFRRAPAVAVPLRRVLSVATVILGAAALSSAVSWLRVSAEARVKDHALSSKTLAQMAKILIWFTAAIIVVSAVMGRSPAFVLSGLGALTAVLMLIFRDSLLGLVAGIQVSQNDMVRVGDWITMAKYQADGTVIDIALTTVKVQNFDNTVTMIPSSALISDAFVNWRYMSVSKGRRIKRPVLINVMSVRPLTPERKAALVAEGLLEEGDRPVSNLAAFEIWLRRMLRADAAITQELTCLVRQTEAGDTGIPVEVYAFTKTRDWVEYENIQTEIFDRIYVTVPKFGLAVYQRTGDRPSGVV